MSKIKYSEQCDAFAQELFDSEMKALGFQFYYKHRWIKIINDEVMIWFGLLPYLSYCYEPTMAIIPLFTDPFYMMDMDGNTMGNWPFNIRLEWLEMNMRLGERGTYRKTERYFMKPIFWDTTEREQLYQTIRKKRCEADKAVFQKIVAPIISRITNLETAIKEIIWIDYILTRGYDTQKQPPVPKNYDGMLMQKWAEDFCMFFQEYDLYEEEVYPLLQYPLGSQDYYYKLCSEKKYDQIEEEIHQVHLNTMAKAKRRLKYEPKEKVLFSPDNPLRRNTPDFLHVPSEYHQKVEDNGYIIKCI